MGATPQSPQQKVARPGKYTIEKLMFTGDARKRKDAHIPKPFVLEINGIPKIQLGIDKVQLTVDPLEIKPVDVSLRLKELPSIRIHSPADFKVSMAVLGLELLTVRLCGEAQVITEPYERDPCEVCGAYKVRLIALDQPTTTGKG
jgi:hypothetical protein